MQMEEQKDAEPVSKGEHFNSRKIGDRVEEVREDRDAKLLFLRNAEARELARDPKLAAADIITAFGMTAPKLCLIILPSRMEQINSRYPYKDVQQQFSEENAIDRFMSEVFIPLAEQTQAVIFCSAVSSQCMLTASLTRMVALKSAKWGAGQCPFTIISTGHVLDLYSNKGQNAVWASWRDHSRWWKMYSKDIDTEHRKRAGQGKDAMEQPDAFLASQQADARPAGFGEPEATVKRWSAIDFDSTGFSPTSQEHTDLDPYASRLLLCDGCDSAPYEPHCAHAELMLAIWRAFATELPSLAIHSGSSAKGTLRSVAQSLGSLETAAHITSMGVPVLLVDTRQRVNLQKWEQVRERVTDIEARLTGRARGSEETKEALTPDWTAEAGAATARDHVSMQPELEGKWHMKQRHLMELYARDQEELLCFFTTCDTLDVCALSYFMSAAFDFGDERDPLDARVPKMLEPLWHAIHNQETQVMLSPEEQGPTSEDLSRLADWLATTIFRGIWGANGGKSREAPHVQFDLEYREHIKAWSTHARSLLQSPNVYHCPLSRMDAVPRLVSKLVTVDRLPAREDIEGLKVLREAWDEYDISMMLAQRYKRKAKWLYRLQLFLGWMIVLFSVCDANLPNPIELAQDGWTLTDPGSGDDTGIGFYAELVFALSLVASLLVTVDGCLNANTRWHILRASAGGLESIIYCYRTRVGAFEFQPGDSRNNAVATLAAALVAWRDELVSSGDLGTSDFTRSYLLKYKKSVFKHYQYGGDLPSPQLSRRRTRRVAAEGMVPTITQDDFHTPLNAKHYLNCRLQKSLNFYMCRVPIYAQSLTGLKAVLLLCGVGSSVLARYNAAPWAAVVTAAAAALTSYIEFADTGKKMHRYSRSIISLKNLITWWNSLSDAQKSTAANITQLVTSGEQIISNERLAWYSTAQSRSNQQDDSRGDGQLSAIMNNLLGKTDPSGGRGANAGDRTGGADDADDGGQAGGTGNGTGTGAK